jgi:hypothetical protein
MRSTSQPRGRAVSSVSARNAREARGGCEAEEGGVGGHAADRLQPRMTAKCAISDSGSPEDKRRIEWRGDVKAQRRRLSLNFS